MSDAVYAFRIVDVFAEEVALTGNPLGAICLSGRVVEIARGTVTL